MSFSSDAKAELVRLPLERDCCIITELAALTQTSGSLSMRGGGRFGISWQVENAALARRIFRMLKDPFGLTPQLVFVEHARLGGRRSCVLSIEGEDAVWLLTALGMMEPDESGKPVLRRTLPHPQVSKACCRRAYIRGAFLGAGAITSPDKGYHLEIVARDESFCELLERQMERSGLPARHEIRRGIPVVYLKGAQEIADTLALMEAPGAMMKLENIRITRQMRGQANRVANCDEHNSERQLTAAQEQVRAIELLAIHRGLYTLPPALREIASLRLEHPDAGLEELGALLDPPVGKSGVNGRMRRLMAAARELRDELTAADDKDPGR
ncbi:MAG: DNA-binding protein WhiA [Clostridia bacterium]|nr:DNA-binding protein WhiA [Clostridia bacterium]